MSAPFSAAHPEQANAAAADKAMDQAQLQLVQVYQAGRNANIAVAADCIALSINFNTAQQTLRSIHSLLAGDLLPQRILVLDNASAASDFEYLRTHLPQTVACEIQLYRSPCNLGFAQGSNAQIALALADPACQYVLLLNNDAIARPALLRSLHQVLQDGANTCIHMAGARMHRISQPDEVDTLGIALYASLMPADRTNLQDPFIGPTGGCVLYSRTLLETLATHSGYCFDARFFCYCEDTDLVLRARLLGFDATFVDEVLALHEGQASSHATGNENFVAYHGLRNSIWMQIKLMPAPLLRKYGVLLALAHVAMALRYTLSGRAAVLLKVYRDAWSQRHGFYRERRAWAAQGWLREERLAPWIAPRFYRRGYILQLLSRALRRNRPR